MIVVVAFTTEVSDLSTPIDTLNIQHANKSSTTQNQRRLLLAYFHCLAINRHEVGFSALSGCRFPRGPRRIHHFETTARQRLRTFPARRPCLFAFAAAAFFVIVTVFLQKTEQRWYCIVNTATLFSLLVVCSARLSAGRRDGSRGD
jgi:hypothetical protein